MINRIRNTGILTAFLAIIAGAQWKLEPPIDKPVTQGIDLVLKQEYDLADSIFVKMSSSYPDHPAGYLYQVAVMQARSIDFDEPVRREKFDSLLELGKKAAQNIESPWKEYFLGTADGYDAYEKVERGDWIDGVRKGMASASWFEDIIEKDSSFYEAYTGIGTYYYWSSKKTAFIRWLPFITDYRETGIRMLETGAERSEYNRFAAVSALVSIYIDAEEFQKVEEWSRKGLKYYPENRIFLWGLVTALDRLDRHREAVEYYGSLLENIMNVGAPNPYSEIVCRLNLAKSKLVLKDTAGVADHLGKILAFQDTLFPEKLKSRAKSKFKDAQKLLTEIENHRKPSK